jgi:hypothetical protein
MAARRLLILMLVLLAVSTLAAALVPPQDGDDATSSNSRTRAIETGRSGERPKPPGRLVSRTIRVVPHGVARVNVRLGDQLALAVRSGVADEVAIPALGQFQALTPEAPARFDLLPERTGVFEVRLVDAKRVIGRIAVRPQEPRESGRRAGKRHK